MAMGQALGQVTGRSSLAFALFALFALSGCFFYDSSWGQRKQAQQRQAARLAPQKLQRQSQAPTLQAQRTLTLRAYATPTHQASVVDWQQQFREQVECANSILTPDFGVALRVEELKTFRPQADEEKLDGMLRELASLDTASEADLVVGLAGAVPRYAASADDLGRARMPGQHIMLRAMSDAQEYEAIQAEFTELSEEARRKLYRNRKHHKLCTVLLHEVAHALGVPHERGPASLMNPRYHVEARGFSEPAAGIFRASLAARVSGQPVTLDAPLAHRLQGLLTDPNADWEPQSRDALLAQINAVVGSPGPKSSPPPSATTAAAVVSVTAPASSPTAGLDSSEQGIFSRARAELTAGRPVDARQTARPLMAKHAGLPAVQELRCDIAMAIGGDPNTLDAECADISPFGPR